MNARELDLGTSLDQVTHWLERKDDGRDSSDDLLDELTADDPDFWNGL